MDANGLQFWMLSQAKDWNLSAAPSLAFSSVTNRLRLLSVSGIVRQPEGDAKALVDRVPMTLDQFDSYARWDPNSGHVVAGGGGPGEVPLYAAPAGQAVTDLALGYDGVLYLAVGGSLVLIDRRNRWPTATLAVPGFTFWRLAPLVEGGVMALDRQARQLGRVTGLPLQTGPIDIPDPGILRSCQQNPDPPQIVARYALPAINQPVAICTMGADVFAVLSWNTAAPSSFVQTFSPSQGFDPAVQLAGAIEPYAMAWIGSQQIAVLVTNCSEALIYDLSSPGVAVSSSDSYVIAGQNLGPFAHAFELPPRYPNPLWFETPPPPWQSSTAYAVGQSVHDSNRATQTVASAGTSGFSEPPWNSAPRGTTTEGSITWTNAGSIAPLLPLVPLSLNSFDATGTTDPANPQIFDSGSTQTVWHRLYLEAIVPPRCGIIVWLAAADSVNDLTLSTTSWYPHLAGSADTSSISADVLADVPTAVWQSETCEVPFATPVLDGESVPNQRGLFMVLVQRAATAVRCLQGRYLGIRVQLNGDSRNTPEVAALRAYASRFSYVEHYLPEIYREGKFGADADVPGPSTRRDFFERFVDLFEGQFTRIEDSVATAYLLTRPESTPDSALDWLGGWVGVEANGYPPGRRRARLEALPDLYRERGTAAGITRALDVATNGLCTSGAIIVIEDFRMRHLFATILGADLSIKENPLLPGYWASSNSFVGDTLFLGNPGMQAELQALYATNLKLPGEQSETLAFYDQFANRLTVFVHDQVESVDYALVQNVVEEEKPAHVLAVVQRASQGIMIGLASLVGVNTYLGPEPSPDPATIGVTQVGRYDIVTNMPSLDPRVGGWQGYTAWTKPVARIKAPASVKAGDPIPLDAGGSTASLGTTLAEYQWSLVSANES